MQEQRSCDENPAEVAAMLRNGVMESRSRNEVPQRVDPRSTIHRGDLHAWDIEPAGELFHFGGGLFLALADGFLDALENEVLEKFGVRGIDH